MLNIKIDSRPYNNSITRIIYLIILKNMRYKFMLNDRIIVNI